MTHFVSVSLAICFSVGPILSSALTYLDISYLLRAESTISEYEYRWEKITGIVVGTGLIGLARPIAADIHFSSLGYMGGTPGGGLNDTGHCFRNYVGGLYLYSKLSNRE
ncbi:hypothetical protein HBI81_250770 [Parastagonospora nodorum]|nr:hypothetical protein HBI18_248840 [Parastagonospora nodorum]KAH6510911.1 hypothetical protein HBI81_250770 [Parastagonospora nodorum]